MKRGGTGRVVLISRHDTKAYLALVEHIECFRLMLIISHKWMFSRPAIIKLISERCCIPHGWYIAGPRAGWASNDEAVTFACEHRPQGMNTDILTKTLACREAAADPDELFPARTVLPDQVKSCIRLVTDSTF
jgi:hypothetical protein